MSESFIIDRIESGFVVAETEDEIKEDEFFKVDSDLTKKRKEEIDHMLKNMWQ